MVIRRSGFQEDNLYTFVAIGYRVHSFFHTGRDVDVRLNSKADMESS